MLKIAQALGADRAEMCIVPLRELQSYTPQPQVDAGGRGQRRGAGHRAWGHAAVGGGAAGCGRPERGACVRRQVIPSTIGQHNSFARALYMKGRLNVFPSVILLAVM